MLTVFLSSLLAAELTLLGFYLLVAHALPLTLSESTSKSVLSQAAFVCSKKAEGSWQYIFQWYQQIVLISRAWVGHMLFVFL